VIFYDILLSKGVRRFDGIFRVMLKGLCFNISILSFNNDV